LITLIVDARHGRRKTRRIRQERQKTSFFEICSIAGG
jgi:hypothetical protein